VTSLDEIVAALVAARTEKQAELAKLDAAIVALRPLAAQPFVVADDPHPDSRRIGPAPAPQKTGPRKRREFTDEQKQEGADLVRRIGPRAASRQLDVVESVLQKWARRFPPKGDGGGRPVGGELERTPVEQPFDNGPAANVTDGTPGDKTGPAGESDLTPDPPAAPAAVTIETAEAVSADTATAMAILDNPEWIDGAEQTPGNAWMRADGQLWECDCGTRRRTIGGLRSHLRSVVNPDNHHPQIMVRAWTQPVVNHLPESDRERPNLAGSTFGCTRCKPPQFFKTETSLEGHVDRVHPSPAKRGAFIDTGLPHPTHRGIDDARRQAFEEADAS
jgi:hypothetical protein